MMWMVGAHPAALVQRGYRHAVLSRAAAAAVAVCVVRLAQRPVLEPRACLQPILRSNATTSNDLLSRN